MPLYFCKAFGFAKDTGAFFVGKGHEEKPKGGRERLAGGGGETGGERRENRRSGA